MSLNLIKKLSTETNRKNSINKISFTINHTFLKSQLNLCNQNKTKMKIKDFKKTLSKSMQAN